MGEIKKAKAKAEEFLYRVTKQQYKAFEKNFKESLPHSFYEGIDWPFCFEAYSYLGHKYKNKIKSFALEVRELWNACIELSKKDFIGSKYIFWSTEARHAEIHQEGIELFPDLEIERHISMFRAKEILGIGGFENYFNRAKKRTINILSFNPFPFISDGDARIIWPIVRSPFLRFSLSDYFKIIAQRIVGDKNFKHFLGIQEVEDNEFFPSIESPTFFQASLVFFLCFGYFGNEFLDLTKKAVSKLIDKQKNDGSFGSCVLPTCLSASSIHFTALDRSNTVCSKAIEYILKKQNSGGSWDFLFRDVEAHDDRNNWNILSTVIVLETLDLITNNEPLALWAEKARPLGIYQKPKSSRIQSISPFQTPEGISWHDVSIRFVSREVAQLRAGDSREGRNFMEMGFEDQRSHTPDLSWRAMVVFGKKHGKISIDIKKPEVPREFRKEIKYYVWTIRKRLKELFDIAEDPFYPYDRKTKTYKLKCSISVSEDID